MWKAKDITPERVKEIVSQCLSLRIGRGRDYSEAEVAEMTSLSRNTVANYRTAERSSELWCFLRMCTVPGIGLRLANKVMEVVGLRVVPMEIEENGNDFQMNAILTDAVGLFGHALADGRIDHTERPEIIEAVKSLRQHADEWLAAHDGVKVRAVK